MLGDHSPVTNTERAVERVRALVPGVEVEIIAGAGHMLPVECPQEFDDRLLRFVDRASRRA